MIAKLRGKLIEKNEHALIVDVNGLCYEVWVPVSVLSRVDSQLDPAGNLELITYHYFQIGPSSGVPILVGFLNEVERDFFLEFIGVSGIGPRAAVRALNKPISEIAHAIDIGDIPYLKTLPGIGLQRAKDVVAKLQGKTGKFALIRDQQMKMQPPPIADFENEALVVLQQLQYKKHEALDMIKKAFERNTNITTAEELLNTIYKQRTNV